MENVKDPCTQKYPVTGTFWCDDFTDVYVGRCDQLSAQPIAQHNYAGSKTTSFDTQVMCCDYVYFVCWSNDSGSNGFVGEIAGVPTNNTDWEIFATGLDFDTAGTRPTRASVLEQINKADCNHYWTKPFLGPKNTGNPAPLPFTVSNISSNANFIWFDAGVPPSPFVGSNQNEYLVIRISAKKLIRECIECECKDCECCDCGCNGCNENAGEQEKVLSKRAKGKTNVIAGTNNASPLCASKPYTTTNCIKAIGVPKLNLCFYLHWGDSATDQIEDDDTETLFITVCNPYADLTFKGLKITKLTIIPTQPLSAMQIVPDSFVCFDCLYPCSCKSREFALITRKAIPGNYNIEVEYCVDEVTVNMDAGGKNSFPITVVQD